MKPLVINLLLVAFLLLSAAFSMAQNNVLTRPGNSRELDSLTACLNQLYQLSKTEWETVNRESQRLDKGAISWSTFLQDTAIWQRSTPQTSGRTEESTLFDIGLKWSSEATHNFRTGISEHEDVFFRSRLATGLDWVLLGEGSWKRRHDERRLLAKQLQRDSLRNLSALSGYTQYRQSEIIAEIFDRYRLSVLEHLVNVRKEAAIFQQTMAASGLADQASVLKKQQASEQAARWMAYIRSSSLEELHNNTQHGTALATMDPELPALDMLLSNTWAEQQRELLAVEQDIHDQELKRYGTDQVSLRTKARYNYYTSPGEQHRGFASVGASLSVPIRWGDSTRRGRMAQQQQQRELHLNTEIANRELQLKSLYREMQAQQRKLKAAQDQMHYTALCMQKEQEVLATAGSPTGFIELTDEYLTSLLNIVEQRELLVRQYIHFMALHGAK